jgi:SLOG in TRPM, prokaryote/SMODS and SLOG-associating 2TM effector domain 1/Protein of unknown function (DUF4231)
MTADAIEKKVVLFPNRNQAVALFPAAHGKAEAIIAALGLKPYKAVILILGGASTLDEQLIPRLTQLFGRGIARAATATAAVIIDGGTQSGVMALIGEGVAGRGYQSPLVGVAPAALVAWPDGPTTGVPLEPHHSHFVLVEGNAWGNETATMYELTRVLTATAPGVAIIAGGGAVTRDEALRAVRHNLPLIIIEGSGGVADEIADWKKQATPPDDPVMAEIIAEGDIRLHPLSHSVKGIERLIIRELGVDHVLTQAWEHFADYDFNATLQQKRFDRLQLAILLLGVAGTALAIAQQVYAPRDAGGNLTRVDASGARLLGWQVVHQLLIIIPILLTVLVAAANRFKQGSKWLLLRAGAEAIKREIYRYRAHALYYKQDAEQQLAQRVEDITRRTMRTEVNTSALLPYNRARGFPPHINPAEGGDDGFSYLTPDRYVELRLSDQLNYFYRRAVKLERELKALYWLTFVIGGLGAYLAAIDRQAWIALTTAIVAALGTYLAYRQTESSLMKYNQVATDLANVKAWWTALSAEEQARQENIDSLVEHTEQVLQSEADGWVQQMQNALAALRKEHEPAKKAAEEGPEPAASPQSESRKDQRRVGKAADGKPHGQAAPTGEPGTDEHAAGAGG